MSAVCLTLALPFPVDERMPALPDRDSQLRREDWVVAGCSQRDAVDFIQRTHYALGAPNTSVARHGLYHRDQLDKLRGVALWLPPTKRAAESVNRENWQGVLALSRLCVADDVPRNGASFLLGASMRRIDRRTWPTLLTYADTYYGHTGAIYLATNWRLLGQVPGSDAWINANGERRGRKRGGRNLSATDMLEAGFTQLPKMPKIKYVHEAA